MCISLSLWGYVTLPLHYRVLLSLVYFLIPEQPQSVQVGYFQWIVYLWGPHFPFTHYQQCVAVGLLLLEQNQEGGRESHYPNSGDF